MGGASKSRMLISTSFPRPYTALSSHLFPRSTPALHPKFHIRSHLHTQTEGHVAASRGPTGLIAVARHRSNAFRSWSASVKVGVGCSCNSYATNTSDVGSERTFTSRNVQDVALKEPLRKRGIGANLSTVEKRKFLMNTLFDLKDSKEAVYRTLDAWVAWEHDFPLVSLKRALVVLEKEEQWHRVVQVIKWMLSKGQGTTVGTYQQLICALEKDNRAEEAHRIWVKKISHDLHSVPWRFCELMISIYYRNNMLDRLVKLFKGLESFERRPPNKSIMQKVADAYEMLGLLEEKDRVLKKYSNLFSDSSKECSKKSRKGSRKNDKKTGKKKHTTTSKEATENVEVDSGHSDEEFS